MRKLILMVQISLDGYVAGPKGEFDGFSDDPEGLHFVCGLTGEADAAVFGRKSYELLNSYWPTAASLPDANKDIVQYSNWYNSVPKFVISHKAGHLANATVIGKDLSAELQVLKQQQGQALLMFGSPSSVHALMELKLLDEIQFLVHPEVFGNGIPLFEESAMRTQLQLLSNRQFASGLLALRYAIK